MSVPGWQQVRPPTGYRSSNALTGIGLPRMAAPSFSYLSVTSNVSERPLRPTKLHDGRRRIGSSVIILIGLVDMEDMGEDSNWVQVSSRTRVRRDPSLNKTVKERDEYTCQNCGSSYEEHPELLEVHAVEPSELVDPNNPENYETLCPNCHRAADLDLAQEIGSEIASSLRQDVKARAKARDHANTIEAFASDAIEITKMNILLGSLLVPAISILIRIRIISSVGSLLNLVIISAGVLWFVSTGLSLWAYFSCRTSGSSLPAIDEVVENGDNEITVENEKAYRWNAYKIGMALLFTVLFLCLVIASMAVAIGT